MKNLSILFIFLMNIGTSWCIESNLYNLFPLKKTTINGKKYPQNGKYLYSGTFKKRISFPQAVNAMLGSEDVYLQSKTFNNIVSCLLKKNNICQKEIINYSDPLLINKQNYRRNYIIREIAKERRINGGRFTDWKLAQKTTVKIIGKYFKKLGKYHIQKNFVEHKYGLSNKKMIHSNTENIDWPSEMVYSSLQAYTAALYGPRIVIIKEKVKRSVDIGFWNFINKGYWYNTQRDMGEFLTLGHILGKDIVGYQIRAKSGGSFKPSKSGIGARWSPEYHLIEYAFYKETVNGIPLVLVFSGDLNSCISKQAAFKYSYCIDPIFDIVKPSKINEARIKNNPKKLQKALLKLQTDPNRYPRAGRYNNAKLIGVFMRQGQLKLPKEVKSYYPRLPISKRDAKWFQRKIDKENLLKIKFFPISLN